MRISIIIPVYNVEKYVRRCLESVMTQKTNGNDVECLIIDDASQDGSMGIVREMVEAYHGDIRFNIITHNKNMGLSMARNTGVMEARNDYILFIDSDDCLMPDGLSLLAEQAMKNPEVDVIIGNTLHQKSGQVLQHNVKEERLYATPDEIYQRMLRHKINLYAWNKLIRSSLLTDNNIFFLSGILYEDQAWSYQLFSHASKVLLLPQVTYIYEDNPESIVNTTFTPERADLTLRSYSVSTTYMLDNPPDKSRYHYNMAVDYLLFINYFMMKGVDLIFRCPVSPDAIHEFRLVRGRLMHRSLCCGRLLLSLFFMLLFTPMSYMQRLRLFRRNYHKIETMVNRLSHMTDFLHNKKRRI